MAQANLPQPEERPQGASRRPHGVNLKGKRSSDADGANGINTLLGQPPNFDNPYGLNSKDAADYIRQGYEDYTNGRWTPDSSK